MKLIVGLGNPGKIYQQTRHNAGFMVIDQLCQTLHCSLNQENFNGQFCRLKINGEDVVLAKPNTFMNLSGDFVSQFCHYFKIETKNILLIFDDFNFPVGAIKLKPKGSSGGQNGVKDILKKLGTEEIKRIKVGIGRPTSEQKDFVLSKFRTNELPDLQRAIQQAAAAAYDFIFEDFNKVLSKYN